MEEEENLKGQPVKGCTGLVEYMNLEIGIVCLKWANRKLAVKVAVTSTINTQREYQTEPNRAEYIPSQRKQRKETYTYLKFM